MKKLISLNALLFSYIHKKTYSLQIWQLFESAAATRLIADLILTCVYKLNQDVKTQIQETSAESIEVRCWYFGAQRGFPEQSARIFIPL